MSEELKTIETVDMSPFKHMVMTIGELPTSFVDSMTYYEALAWLVNYMEVNVVPAINTNADALKELQDAFVVLKNYVDNYFANLDVQEEINTKLDEMAQNGELLELLNAYDYALNILTFGCVGDGTTDNTTNLNTAFAYCYTNKRTLYVPKGTFAFETPISVTNLPNIKMDGTLKYTGSSTDFALTLGDTANEQNNLDLEFMLECEKSTTNKGLKLININNSNIKLKYIYGFGTGVTLEGNTKGFCYNKIDCYNIYNNNVGLDIAPTSAGWVNENLFLNGNFKYSNQLDKTGTIGIRITGITDRWVNNNYFLKPSFEQLDKCVSLTQCCNNTFTQCRCEKINVSLVTDTLSRVNEFELGYGNDVTDIKNACNIYKTQAKKILDTPVLAYHMVYNDHTTFETDNNVIYMNTDDYCVMHSGGSTSTGLSYTSNFLLSDGYLKQLVTNKAIGVFIKTDTIKKFYAHKETLFSEPGRWFIRFYDENKDVISNLGDFVTLSESMNKYNDINNGYRTLADLNHDFAFIVPDNAKYIFFGLTRVGTPYSIKSMDIWADSTFTFADKLSDLA